MRAAVIFAGTVGTASVSNYSRWTFLIGRPLGSAFFLALKAFGKTYLTTGFSRLLRQVVTEFLQ